MDKQLVCLHWYGFVLGFGRVYPLRFVLTSSKSFFDLLSTDVLWWWWWVYVWIDGPNLRLTMPSRTYVLIALCLCALFDGAISWGVPSRIIVQHKSDISIRALEFKRIGPRLFAARSTWYNKHLVLSSQIFQRTNERYWTSCWHYIVLLLCKMNMGLFPHALYRWWWVCLPALGFISLRNFTINQAVCLYSLFCMFDCESVVHVEMICKASPRFAVHIHYNCDGSCLLERPPFGTRTNRRYVRIGMDLCLPLDVFIVCDPCWHQTLSLICVWIDDPNLRLTMPSTNRAWVCVSSLVLAIVWSYCWS